MSETRNLPNDDRKIEKTVSRWVAFIQDGMKLSIDYRIQELQKILNLDLNEEQQETLKKYVTRNFAEMETVKLVLQGAVEDKVQLEDNKVDLIRQHASASYDKAKLLPFVKFAMCPIQLHRAMELFPVRFLMCVKAAFRRQNDLHAKFKKLTNPTRIKKLVINDIKHFASISKLNDNDREIEFKTVWERFRGDVAKRGLSRPSQTARELQLAVFELYEASNLQDALMEYEKRIDSVWSQLSDPLTADDVKSIKDLITRPPAILLESVVDQLRANYLEMEYMEAVFTDEISTKIDTDEYYRQCL
ncbi:uncharacterized protein LOC135841475 [Planococcus citri]|uniref:uncharacterized protein LOC135841475 n=1 Tax=Planococcus citri TaxID=170843 RepID=UPI0031F850EE